MRCGRSAKTRSKAMTAPRSTVSTPVVSVFVDATEAAPTNAETGVTVEAGPQVGPNTLQAILCDGVIEVTARTPDGMPLAFGTPVAG